MAENTLIEKILGLRDKYLSLQNQLSDPSVTSDMKKFVQLNKDYKGLEPIVQAGLDYKKQVDELSEAKNILANEKDEDLRNMAKEEIAEIEPKLPEMEEQIKILLLPADPDDSKNAIVEIRHRIHIGYAAAVCHKTTTGNAVGYDIYGSDDTSHPLDSFKQSGERLRLLWRCDSARQLGDVLQECCPHGCHGCVTA